MSDVQLEPVFSLPSGFTFGEVPSDPTAAGDAAPVPSLGPLTAFTGTFRGSGFNTIFRPDLGSPTPLPIPRNTSDNLLELNLTQETLSFSPSLGDVPNRGEIQKDVHLNGVPYLQVIQDVTIPSQPIGIHFEPGLWMCMPQTTHPNVPQTVFRMASIPHGTTIEAQGTFSTSNGPPNIGSRDITPFFTGTPGNKNRFPSQDISNEKTARIPQDLTSFVAAGTITKAMLDDPNTLLRNHIASQDITSTTQIDISTQSAVPPFGGGTDNIAFLLGDRAGSNPNANAVKMEATFWIETVEFTIQVPVFNPGQPPLVIPAETGTAGQPVPEFLVNPPIAITAPRTIKVAATQIQYSQLVLLVFNGLSWPHVSVATLVPASPVPVPPSVWT